MAAFSLFEKEEKVLEDGQRLAQSLTQDQAPEALQKGVGTLVEAYRKSIREQRRLVRVSDRQQEQLSVVNQELQRRREEAETALAQLREAQDSLIQAEKLASLGALVAGVAHEINTPVGIALSAASHLSDATGEVNRLFTDGKIKKSDFQDYIATAVEAAKLILGNCDRAAELIQGFKQVAVDQTSAERRRFRLGAYIHEVLLSLTPKLRLAQVEAVVDCPDDLVLDSYPGALSQILTNLVMNALIHAFENRQEGVITIKANTPEPGIVAIKISDNGCGIPTDIVAKIFDPFFTTKRGSGGNGLGLHIVYNIVAGTLKGQIAVESVLGQGSCFSITMPSIAPCEASPQG